MRIRLRKRRMKRISWDAEKGKDKFIVKIDEKYAFS